MRELCINIQRDFPLLMFGNKSSGILGQIARILSVPHARRESCEAILQRSQFEHARRLARAQQERYFVPLQYPWCKP